MRAVLRVLAPLLGLALAAAGVLVVIEVVAAWVLPDTEGLLVPWRPWGVTLANLSWNENPVPGIAIGVGAAGLLLIIVGFAARRGDVRLEAPTTAMTVTTLRRVLARLVGIRVRAFDDVLSASVSASARRVGVTVVAWHDAPPDLREVIVGRVKELLDALPLRRRPRVAVSVRTRRRAMSVDLTKSHQIIPAPRPTDARLRRRSRSAVARSATGDRWLLVLIGLVLLAVGVGVTLLYYGAFGSSRAARPLLDPIIVDTVATNPVLWRVIAIAGGIVLA